MCELHSLVDGGAAAPWQSRTRLQLIDAGYPRPQPQVAVLAGAQPVGHLDIGWPEYRVAVEYGPKDVARQRMLEALGWLVIRTRAEDRPVEWLPRVEAALASRGCFVVDDLAA